MTAVRRARRRLRLGIALSLAISPVLIWSGPSYAEASFTSRAEAQTLHVTITNDKGSIPTLPQIDAGVGTAQATFSSFGGGLARAASPDAGSAASVPALVGALVPTLIPRLPFTVPAIAIPGDITVQAGEKPAKVATGPYALGAEVTDSSAKAKATLGGSLDDDNAVLRATSSANISVAEDETVTATASSVVDGVRLNGLVKIGEVRSEVEVVRDPDGKIHRSASTTVGLLELAGLSLEFRDDQFVTPIGKLPVSLKHVTKLISTLTAGMVDLEVVSARETKNGMVSGSLRLVQTVPPPPKCIAIPLPTPIISGVTYCGTTTVVYDLGKAAASTDYSVIPDSTEGGGGTVVPPVAGEGPVASPEVSLGESPLGLSPPLSPGGIEPALPVLTPPVDDPALLSVAARFVNVSNIYLALVGFGVLLLLSSTCIRLLGVRNKWTS